MSNNYSDNSDSSSSLYHDSHEYSDEYSQDYDIEYYKCGFECVTDFDFSNSEDDHDYFYLNICVPYDMDMNDIKNSIIDQIDTINSVLDTKYSVICENTNNIKLEKLNNNFNGKIDYEIEKD